MSTSDTTATRAEGLAAAQAWREQHRPAFDGIYGPSKPRRRAIPDDFTTHAPIETNDALSHRYTASAATIRRWRAETNIERPLASRARSLPQGFAAVAPRFTVSDLRVRYSVSIKTVKRWLGEAGITAATVSRPRSTTNAGGHLNGKIDRPHIDVSRAGLAAEYLRKFSPVIRCDARGNYTAKGDHWRRGHKVLSADEVIARAERNGFDPDMWRRVA